MEISAQVSPDDIRDFFDRLDGPGKRKLHAGFANIILLLGAIFLLGLLSEVGWAIGEQIYRGISDKLLLISAVFGLFLVAWTIVWFRGAWRMKREVRDGVKNVIDETALQDGMNFGETRFSFDNDGIRLSRALVQASYTWGAFQGLEEFEKNFFLMIHKGSALIVPRTAFSGGDSVDAFKAFVGSRIGTS